MPAYALFDNLAVHDLDALERYKRETAPIVERHGGRYVVLGGQVDVVEGDWRPTYLVMIEFPTLADARRWYASKEYRDLRALRLAATRSTGVIVEGV